MVNYSILIVGNHFIIIKYLGSVLGLVYSRYPETCIEQDLMLLCSEWFKEKKTWLKLLKKEL